MSVMSEFPDMRRRLRCPRECSSSSESDSESMCCRARACAPSSSVESIDISVKGRMWMMVSCV
jgi:hypothetical protein